MEVLRELVVGLVCCGFFADRDSMVSQWLVCLLNIRLEKHFCEVQGTGEKADTGENEEAWMGKPLEVGVGVYGACT